MTDEMHESRAIAMAEELCPGCGHLLVTHDANGCNEDRDLYGAAPPLRAKVEVCNCLLRPANIRLVFREWAEEDWRKRDGRV